MCDDVQTKENNEENCKLFIYGYETSKIWDFFLKNNNNYCEHKRN